MDDNVGEWESVLEEENEREVVALRENETEHVLDREDVKEKVVGEVDGVGEFENDVDCDKSKLPVLVEEILFEVEDDGVWEEVHEAEGERETEDREIELLPVDEVEMESDGVRDWVGNKLME